MKTMRYIYCPLGITWTFERQLPSAMDTSPIWDDLLAQKFKVFKAEATIYVESSQRSNGPDMYAKYICDNLGPSDVPHDLKKLYMEAVYGSNDNVKKRIRSRMYLIGRHVRLVICLSHAKRPIIILLVT